VQEAVDLFAQMARGFISQENFCNLNAFFCIFGQKI